jgi:hypothetical protein
MAKQPRPCDSWIKTGTCSYGDRCHWAHPRQRKSGAMQRKSGGSDSDLLGLMDAMMDSDLKELGLMDSDLLKIQPALVEHGLVTARDLLGFLKDECGGVTSDGLKQMGIAEYGTRNRILKKLQRFEQKWPIAVGILLLTASVLCVLLVHYVV